jgi:hypothetical protein
LNHLDTLVLNNNVNLAGGANELCAAESDPTKSLSGVWLHNFYADCQSLMANNNNDPCLCCTIRCDCVNDPNAANCTKPVCATNIDPTSQYNYVRRFYQMDEEDIMFPILPMATHPIDISDIDGSVEYGQLMDSSPVLGDNNDDVIGRR